MYRNFSYLLLITFSAGMLLAQSADNTGVNKNSEPTADQARNTKTDRELMQNIRKSIVDDKSLSTYAHNVKVISQHGKVTLKGPVRSDEERKTIESKAEEIAGSGNVVDQLSVKPETPKS
jgi:osmotically-inducible protein OsmY